VYGILKKTLCEDWDAGFSFRFYKRYLSKELNHVSDLARRFYHTTSGIAHGHEIVADPGSGQACGDGWIDGRMEVAPFELAFTIACPEILTP